MINDGDRVILDKGTASEKEVTVFCHIAVEAPKMAYVYDDGYEPVMQSYAVQTCRLTEIETTELT